MAEETARESEKKGKDVPSGAGTEAEGSAAPAKTAPEPSPETQEIIRLRDCLIRLQADFENLRKRHQREREQWIQMAEESLVRDLIPVLDHFEYGIRHAEAEPEGKRYAEGMRLILSEFQECLRRHGVEILDAVGQPFDPEWHEAIAHVPSEKAEGINLSQMAPGYRMGGRLLRPARVVVSSGPSPTVLPEQTQGN